MSGVRKSAKAQSLPPKPPVDHADDVGVDQASDAYAIGYSKPPVHSRFKPGQSGNPKGKRKGRKSYKTIVSGALLEKITVQTPRGKKRMTKLEALMQTNMNNALKGDSKATDHIMKIAREYGLSDEVAEALDTASVNALRDEDRAILERHLGTESGEQV